MLLPIVRRKFVHAICAQLKMARTVRTIKKGGFFFDMSVAKGSAEITLAHYRMRMITITSQMET